MVRRLAPPGPLGVHPSQPDARGQNAGSGVAGVAGLAALGWEPVPVALALLAHSVAWLAAEAWFLAAYGLPFGPRAWAASLVREALVPVLLIQAWRGRGKIDWRGTDLAAGWRPAGGDDPSGRYV